MSDPTNKQKDISTKLSRRKLLRNSFMTATGAVLLPSFLTGCHKDVCDIFLGHGGHGHVGGVELTPEELAAAADNLTRLRAWITDLYPLCIEYEDIVFHALASTTDNDDWNTFIGDIFIDIAVGIAGALPFLDVAMPAIGCLADFLKDWSSGNDKPTKLNQTFADFETGHNQAQFEIEQKLSSLVEPSNNYSNLTEAWKDDIVFNGVTYTIGDLASSYFPDLGDDYNTLQTAAFIYFKKSLWNLVVMKCCTYYENWHTEADIFRDIDPSLTSWAQDFYAETAIDNKGVYVRGTLTDNGTTPDGREWANFDVVYWNLGIGGYPFPDEACNILFKDDTPGHIINPDGLFNRSYVFEQFSTTKPDFSKGHELGYDIDHDFSGADDWNFTGGLFPRLAK